MRILTLALASHTDAGCGGKPTPGSRLGPPPDEVRMPAPGGGVERAPQPQIAGGDASGDPPVVAHAAWSRREFEELVVGKTEAELLKVVREPERISEPGPSPKHFWFADVTVDPKTGKMDRLTRVDLTDGKVTGVGY
jgi:hypothetical protein